MAFLGGAGSPYMGGLGGGFGGYGGYGGMSSMYGRQSMMGPNG